MPRLHETEDTPADEKLIWAHLFLGDSHWYAAEFDGKDTFFGYVILNGDMMNSEWGYFSLAELTELRVGPFVVCVEDGWRVREFKEVMSERHAEGDGVADGFRRHESKMPRIGETDGVPFEDKEIWLHFFRLGSGSHWMAAESNGRGLYFGCVVLDGDFDNVEWGYFTIDGMGIAPGLMVLCRETVKRFEDVIAEVSEG